MDDDAMNIKSGKIKTNAAPQPARRPHSDTDPIAIGLQQLFAAVAEEPVPDEFMALLDRIDANDRARDSAAAPNDGSAAGEPK